MRRKIKNKNKAIATQEPDGMSEFLEYCYSQGDGFGVRSQCARPSVVLCPSPQSTPVQAFGAPSQFVLSAFVFVAPACCVQEDF